MEPELAAALRSLIESQEIAALATLHRGEPAVSMVPYALLPLGQGLLIHVSRLATHTADMLANPAVAMLVVSPPGSAASPQELPRASVQGRARQLITGSREYGNARARYLERFAHSEEMFGFSDFSLFAIAATSIRFVGGFAKATTILAAEYAVVMSGSA